MKRNRRHMERHRQLLLECLLSCIPVLGLLFAAGCVTEREDPVVPMEVAESVPVGQAWNVTFVVREGGIRRMEILAGHMARYESEDSTVVVLSSGEQATPVRVDLYNREGLEAATMTAHRVRYDEREQVMVARGDVVVTGSDDTRLETEMLVWNETGREITSSSYVRIETATDVWQGYGFRADEDLRNFNLSQVRARLEIPDE